ncbi:MAG: hypothetical protein R6U70_03415, partial [Bacillota bacterium]
MKRPTPAGWWALIILFYPLLNLITALVAATAGISNSPLNIMSIEQLLSPARLISVFAFALLFPLPEEIGLLRLLAGSAAGAVQCPVSRPHTRGGLGRLAPAPVLHAG